MTTAKPEPMAGQPDEHDDLIAELAKLMAQDDQGNSPAPAAAPQAPRPPAPPAFQNARPAPQPPAPQPAPFQVRIPGGDMPAVSAEPTPNPRFDFGRSGEGAAPAPAVSRQIDPAARQEPVAPRQEPITPRPAAPVAPARQEAPSRPEPSFVSPAPPRAAPNAPSVDAASEDAPYKPFNFDLDLGADKRGPTEPIPARTFVPPAAPVPPRTEPPLRPRVEPQLADQQPRQSPVAPPLSAPVVPPQAAPVAPPPADAHDSIADLIAAEFFNDSADGNTEQDEPYFDTDVVASPVEPKATAPEADRFAVPPVFGLGSPTPPPAPAAAVPPIPVSIPAAPPRAAEPFAPVSRAQATPTADDNVGLDPIDEIESLIGRAGRVERNENPIAPPVPERPAPSAALRSLATPTMPANPPPTLRAAAPIPRAPAPGSRSRHAGADEAILAAAAATGADVGWVHSPGLEDPDQAYAAAPQRAPRGFRLSRRVAAPLVALTLFAAAGFGLYWVLGNVAAPSGPAPLLTADSTPVKETPTVDPAATTSNQSVVFNEIDGVQPGADEQLVSRDQADVNEVTQVPPAETSDEGLANRKVRTVTVRPDGTIVSSDDSVAGSSMLPVVRPNVPAVPGAQTASSALTTASAEPSVTTPPATTPQPITPPAPTVTPVNAGATVAVVDASGTVVPGKTTVIPLAKPSSFRPQPTAASPATSVNAIIQQTPAAPAAAATAPTPAPEAGSAQLSNAPAYVQLASHRTEAEARQSANNIVSRFGPLFKGANLEVQRVELGDRGIYYRVRVPADSLQSANDLCAQVKAAGGDCFSM